ncbi:polyketide synthase [Chitinophaga nivalis]|uniref:Polyketide synthase n=1 Tax=Chitinophaga nivalis TaxID=2991709 RepID=A0ABT3IKW1_9BACT|nr:polyketide synthase [Chitinophaga nivalis]MCW3465905.1 polyketide synthase [Chitinophaga nivalis]MCW3484404.1 polyketide synthase [Chitinophaga nivalis]
MEQVVKLTELEAGIVQVTMEDKDSRNTFTKELMSALITVFAEIRRHPGYKVVILTGYENYFCCGGTKEELIRIHQSDAKFNELNFFTCPLECEIPVISAMQGHGIGGGFVFGLYADFAILGRENVYTTNFMKYGFTPGLGATLMVPLKLGEVLGNEMLHSAKNYRGEELKERGIPFKVVPKAQVMSEAMALARELAEKPRLSLVTLKKHLTAHIREKLPIAIEQELHMHEITFHQPEVGERIETSFGK